MDSQGDYTTEELEELRRGVAALVLAAASADRSGPVAYFEEMTAAGRFLFDAAKRYPGNDLIAKVVREDAVRGEDEGEEGEGEVDRADLLDRVARVEAIVRRDEEGLEFRRFLLDLAERVVAAGRNTPFGPKVSDEERQFMTQLKSSLGLAD